MGDRGLSRTKRGLLLAGMGLLAVAVWSGCHEKPDVSGKTSRSDVAAKRNSESLFENAVQQLNVLEELPNSRETLRTVTSRLGEWIEQQSPDEDWSPDPRMEAIRSTAADVADRTDAMTKQVRDLTTVAGAEQVLDGTKSLAEELHATADAFGQLRDQTAFSLFGFLEGQFTSLAGMLEEQAADETRPATERAKAIQSALQGFNADEVANLSNQLREMVAIMDPSPMAFDRDDSDVLQQAVWVRDIAQWAVGDETDELARADALFDWTVRNVELAPERDPRGGQDYVRPAQAPWQTLLYGRGGWSDRAWVFALLLREIGMDAVVLSIPIEQGEEIADVQFAVAVPIDGKLYLYDPWLGIPLPAPGGATLAEGGELAIRPATLSEAATNDEVFRALDAINGEAYPVKSEMIHDVTVSVIASPVEVSQRMALLQANLAGETRIQLTASPERVAGAFQGMDLVKGVRLWNQPLRVTAQRVFAPDAVGFEASLFEVKWSLDDAEMEDTDDAAENDGRFFGEQTSKDSASTRDGAGGGRTRSSVEEAPLWKGRVLYFAGDFAGPGSAATYLQACRISDRDLSADAIAPQQRALMEHVKLTASCFLGVMSAEQGKDASAIDYLQKRTIFSDPGMFHPGAIYNLARVYESQGEYDRALEWYEMDRATPNRFGSMARATLLRRQLGATSAAPSAGE